MWPIAHRLFLGDYDSGALALAGEEHPTPPNGSPAPFAGVVSLCPMPLFPGPRPKGPARADTEWLLLPIADGGNGEDELTSALALTLPFIRRRLPHGNVLVHCAAGMSRSVTVVAALLCEDLRIDADLALARVAELKAKSFRHLNYPPELLVAPAPEFRAVLRRMFSGRGPSNGDSPR